ncbi:META domain-containing protein [Devosia sp. ZB163]|uniref:META domain-containing protein n=1 Tax=Devosia sp. ZB163 TaxID=3025938 RepID=UPI00235F65DC|nr:META domain-containing protein [Devosia sp. ZB163]MDC9825470.1 META domain-containing protein [Devosia sp. ZB163]
MRIGLASILLVLALASPALADKVTITGDITYRERIALQPGAQLTVSLIDLATPAQPRVSATALIDGPGTQVPLTFTLNFEDSVVLPGHSYALEAEIAGADGIAWFRTATPYAVDPLAPGDEIEIIVGRVARVDTTPDETAAAPEPAVVEPPILNITWQARVIGGKPVPRTIVSSLSIASDKRAGGRGGCNSWFAQAEIHAQRIAFSAVAATRVACLSDDATQQEDSFFKALAATRSWRLDGETLVLADSSGAELARLEKSRF